MEALRRPLGPLNHMIAPTQQPEHYRSRVIRKFADPVRFCRLFWPQFTLYDKQREIMYSVRDNYETIVPAGNELGKDFISALTVLWFFISRRPCKVVTTSSDNGQLADVLWGEIRRFIDYAKYPLPIQYNHMRIRQVKNDGSLIPNSELVGRVVQKGEALLGRHIERTALHEPTTLLVVDEASGVEDVSYEVADTWTHRKLVIGNPYPCTNFFFKGVREGDLESERKDTGEENLYRKVIKVKATDSPNIQLALAEVKAGKKPSHRELIPGLARYSDYLQRRKVWDEVRQCIGLDAEFYEGAEVLMFPPLWLNTAEQLATKLTVQNRVAQGIGIDPAEGKDSTSFSAVDEHGLIEQISKKTPDTAVVTGETLAFMRKHRLDPSKYEDCRKVIFDRGGGGKQHADRLRNQGYEVRTVGFGESATKPISPGIDPISIRKKEQETRYVYYNKRAEMYGRLRIRLDPAEGLRFALPASYTELRKQLGVIPLQYDAEGRIKLPPKNKANPNSKETTLVELIGHSPDEADSLVLAVYAMEVKEGIMAGVL